MPLEQYGNVTGPLIPENSVSSRGKGADDVSASWERASQPSRRSSAAGSRGPTKPWLRMRRIREAKTERSHGIPDDTTRERFIDEQKSMFCSPKVVPVRTVCTPPEWGEKRKLRMSHRLGHAYAAGGSRIGKWKARGYTAQAVTCCPTLRNPMIPTPRLFVLYRHVPR